MGKGGRKIAQNSDVLFDCPLSSQAWKTVTSFMDDPTREQAAHK